MTSVFHLVRHAATDHLGHVLSGRAPGVPLSGEGIRQARLLGRRLSSVPLASILTSPRRRARETAAIVAEQAGVRPQAVELLDEVDFGRWSGRPFSELEDDPEWRRWNEHRDDARTPGGETMDDVAGRVIVQMASLHRKEPGRAHLLVTHADVIKAAVCRYLGLPFRSVFDFDIDPASVTVIAADEASGVVLARNADPGAAFSGLAA